MILVVDNHDSFTYNLVHYLLELRVEVEVHESDAITVDDIVHRAPRGVLISPGPGRPHDAGVSLGVVEAMPAPILGVCLGHQCIAERFGGRVVRAGRLMHGRTSPVEHGGDGVFAGLPSPFIAARYHSLLVERASLPECLEVTAWTAEGEIMGIRHRTLPVEGVQFHPESFLTDHGHALLGNWLASLDAGLRTAEKSGAASLSSQNA